MGLFNAAAEAFNQVTDTIGDGAAQLVSDAGEAFNQVTDTAKKTVDTSSQDNNYDVPPPPPPDIDMLLNPEEHREKAVEQGQIEIPDWEKDLFAAAPEVDVDTSSQDNKGINLNLWDALDTLVDFSNRVPPVDQMVSTDDKELKDAGEAVKDATDKAKKTVNKFLPANIGKNLGLALYGLLAVVGIGVFVYILSLLKPIFQIGANVSDK